MTGRLRLAGLIAATTVTWLATSLPIVAGSAATHRPRPAASAGAPLTAWWNSGNLGNGLPGLPTSPDVSGRQLFVEGSNAVIALGVFGAAPTSSEAVAAISWQIPSGQTAKTLSLPVAGTPPPAASVQACRITGKFAAVYGGPYSAVPAYTCKTRIDGTLNGNHLVFDGIGKLATGGRLSVLLLPGPLDRVVLAPPTPAALVLAATPVTPVKHHHPTHHHPTHSGGQHHHATHHHSGGHSTSPGGSGGSAGGGSGGGSGPLPPIDATHGGSTAGGQQPVVAGSGNGTTTVGANPVSSITPSSTWRRGAAAVVIVLEVVVFAFTRRRSSVPGGAPPGRGIGRFIADRSAPPVHL